jgi:organic radical activating enzyme
MQLLYHEDGSITNISSEDLKRLRLNYMDWYCPIDEHVWNINWDGTLKSGVCGQMRISNNADRPFWKGGHPRPKLSRICSMPRLQCHCGADLNSPKAIDLDTYNTFLEIVKTKGQELINAPYYKEEKSKIVATGAFEKWAESTFDLHINVGRKCNFDCSYCSAETHDNFSPFVTLKNLNLGIRMIDKYSKNAVHKQCTFTGGEPTIWKDLENALLLVKSMGYTKISINTNGTAPKTKLSRIIENFNTKIDITFHPEFTTDKIAKKILEIKEMYPNNVKLKMMDPPIRFKSRIDRLNVSNVHIDIMPIFDKGAITNSMEFIKL